MKYIAYGSNMNLDQMRVRCPKARLIGLGHLPQYKLEFNHYATILPSDNPQDFVPIAAWEITDECEKNLDAYEDFPDYYIKVDITAHMDDGSQITGMVYQMRTFSFKAPPMDYYQGICDAYTQLGIGDKIAPVMEAALKRSQEKSGQE